MISMWLAKILLSYDDNETLQSYLIFEVTSPEFSASLSVTNSKNVSLRNKKTVGFKSQYTIILSVIPCIKNWGEIHIYVCFNIV